MTELQFVANSFPVWKAMLWVFYPMSILVFFELFLGAVNDDDDDDGDGGKPILAYTPSA